MSLMEHLGELRMRLVRIVVVLLVSCLIFYLATPTIAQFMLMPVAEYLPANEDGQVLLNVFGAFDAFGLRFQIAFWASLVATAPFILWQILAFFLPALKPKERKWFVPTFIAGVGLFILGTIFCYLIILPPAFEWLTDQASGFATIMPEASRWVDIIIKFEIGFGFGFDSGFSSKVKLNIRSNTSMSSYTTQKETAQELREQLTARVDLRFGKYFGSVGTLYEFYCNSRSHALTRHNVILNASAGRKFGKENRLGLSVGVIDILNRPDYATTSFDTDYIVTSSTSYLGRYGYLRVAYTF